MGKYILKRILYAVIALFVVSTIAFFAVRMIPGNPIEAMTEKLPDEIRQQVFEQYGFDKPIMEQYKLFFKELFTEGDLGESLKYRGRKVTDTIASYAPVSGLLGAEAIAIGVISGIILGIVAALNRGKWLDYLVMFIAVVGIAVPNFVLASCFQYFLTIRFHLFPTTGWEGFSYTVLPALALSFNSTAKYARYMRANCLDVLNQDYIITAKSKGMSKFRLIRKHVLKNSILPIITLLGPQIALMFGGAFVIERIFAIPGLGSYFVSSVTDRDYTMVMGQTIFIAALYILSVLIVDILYGFIDPRIRISQRGGRDGN
ncbi:ABC transporter permease [Lachnospiraceae bacterium BX10]|jgi:dipeptide/oligopeptide/nickel ABC transporter, permease protein|uniref:ABC transporter permease n=1 Tax=Enterocloster hominis (ex Liu et al. 2021) TaxID=2763663 RepID=A0ABR7NTK2_9FIRM|nr:ABC transporter permease [Enterocloster hominis]MBC8599437.1 ABC transporter permease [Enterocloster hominis]